MERQSCGVLWYEDYGGKHLSKRRVFSLKWKREVVMDSGVDEKGDLGRAG